MSSGLHNSVGGLVSSTSAILKNASLSKQINLDYFPSLFKMIFMRSTIYHRNLGTIFIKTSPQTEAVPSEVHCAVTNTDHFSCWVQAVAVNNFRQLLIQTEFLMSAIQSLLKSRSRIKIVTSMLMQPFFRSIIRIACLD